ncbi:unnamed protein product [Adineta ricciae]|uniref:Uncharacterized protein n=1 Tax=Adineta ricciae TaxID=249248 RepID=A0A814LGB2_ADIRI|nr:unnamed protein product [Adineta ricciae]
MSYGSNLLAEYPASYNQTVLPNIESNTRAAFANSYQTENSYRNNDLRSSQERMTHQRSSISQSSSIANSRKPAPPNQPVPSLNEMPEYEESLGTASSVARSINKFPNVQQNHQLYTNNTDPNPSSQSNQPTLQTKTPKQSTLRTQPIKDVNRKPTKNEAYEDERANLSVPVDGWVNDAKKKSVADGKSTKQAWAVKTEHTGPTQSDKSIRSKPIENKVNRNKSKSFTQPISRDKTYEIQNDPYFDEIDREDSSPHQPTPTKPYHQQSPTNPKTSLYESPSSKRLPGVTTAKSWKRPDQTQFSMDSPHFDYTQSELSDRDNLHKNADERFREALQKLRSDRAKQQKELSETTAKRLQYGDYIRHSTRDELLQSVVKSPSSTGFLELRKGNLLSIFKEEKKELYDQSRSYAERVRYRNYDKWQENEIAKSLQQNALHKDASQESESSNLTPRQKMKNGRTKSIDRSLQRHQSEITTQTKQKDARDVNQIKTSERVRNALRTRRSDDDYENLVDFNANRKKTDPERKKKKVSYAKYDSVGRETSGIEDNDDDFPNRTPRIMQLKLRQVTSNLYTLEEEKSLGDLRQRKR